MDSSKRKTEADFQFGRVLGEGSFSTVYVARDISSRKEFAIKVCDKAHIIRERKQEYVAREKHALQKLKTVKGVIELFCTFQSPTKLFFVVTLARNGDLLKYIQQTGCLRLECAKFYAAELLVAIEGMHRNNVIHRDIKPENILLDENMHLLIADFGSAKILSDNYDYHAEQEEIERNRRNEENGHDEPVRPMRRSSFVGTAQYVSPEVLNGDAAHPAMDLFSYGCILYQMLCGKFAFNAPNEYLTFQKILKLNYKFNDDFNTEGKDLIEKLLLLKPEQRLGAKDPKDLLYVSIRTHPFFIGIEFENLFNSTPPPFVE
ncbi:hypothetical protein PVAND_015992 [Polypedilum vanderplanki]|uniref:non-specific serine/threonine protein kinase n=1 Tax=Polypedilum vanderplanki TaxID=319348 RepID=A0A9J6BEW5_POLVA|nr:hypothetical protein PVAND_015992 [Polypedilum vanderplanki]